MAGAFASSTQIDSKESRDVELSGFIGYAWNVTDNWRGKVLASHYAYPWNQAGSHYDYDELDFDLAYQDWLHFSLSYSPNSPRFLREYHEFVGVTEKSAEVSRATTGLWRILPHGRRGLQLLGRARRRRLCLLERRRRL